MPLVRYLALMALVVWIGGLIAVGLVAPGAWRGRGDLIAFACGAVLIACYLILKLVGPPPHAFPIRLGLAAAMLAAALAGRFVAGPAPAAVETALGLVLLTWYVRE